MSLDFTILGFLHYRPSSGYDLKAVLDLTCIWPAEQSQIYRTLSRLVEKKWIESEIIRQSSRPDRKVYHITTDGDKALMQWLKTPLFAAEVRSPMLVQFFFSGYLPDDQAIAIIKGQSDIVIQGIEELRTKRAEYQPSESDSHEMMHQKFIADALTDYYLRALQTVLDWQKDTIVRIERGEHHKKFSKSRLNKSETGKKERRSVDNKKSVENRRKNGGKTKLDGIK
jgi:PadR family transcriptional regulator, regulatory protein AphA